VAMAILNEGARHRDEPDRQEVYQREVQADAEHQQDDADLGEIDGERWVGDEARSGGADQNTR
jgi:hypothetical protein